MTEDQATQDRIEALTSQLAELLQGWMQERRLSAESLALRLGYHRSTVAHAMTGRDTPADDFYNRCHQAFGGAERLVSVRLELEEARKARRRAARARRRVVPDQGHPIEPEGPPTSAARELRPTMLDFISWVADHSRLSFEQVYTSVASRVEALEQLPRPVKFGRAHAQRKLTRQRLADVLLTYYSTSLDRSSYGAGFYRASTGGTELGLSILTRPEWLNSAARLDSESEQYYLRPTAQEIDIPPLENLALEEALNKLAGAEESGTVLYNSPLYRLLDIAVADGALTTTFGLTDFAGYALTADLMEGELVRSLTAEEPADQLPLRDAHLPTIASALAFEERLCVGGPLALLAIARSDSRSGRDYLLLIQERSPKVVNATGKLAVVPKAFHGPTSDLTAEARLSASLERELEEELLGRPELEQLTDDAHRKADPFHPDELSEPMRWLADRRHTDSYRLECVGFGINMLNGNFEFPCLIVIDDEEWWSRYGGRIEANWEIQRIRRYSSRDATGLQALALDPRWSDEGLFAFIQGLQRLARIDTMSRVDIPEMLVEV